MDTQNEQQQPQTSEESKLFVLNPSNKPVMPLTQCQETILKLLENIKQKSYELNTSKVIPSEYVELYISYTECLQQFSSFISEENSLSQMSFNIIYQLVYSLRHPLPKVYLFSIVGTNPSYTNLFNDFKLFFKTQDFFFSQITNPIAEYYARVYCYERCEGMFDQFDNNDEIINFRVSNLLRLVFLFNETRKKLSNKQVNDVKEEMISIIQPIIIEAKNVLIFPFKNESERDKIIKQLIQLVLPEEKVYNEFIMDLILNNITNKCLFSNMLDIVKKVEDCFDFDANILSKLITMIEKLLISDEYSSTENKQLLIPFEIFDQIIKIIQNLFKRVEQIDYYDGLNNMFGMLLVVTKFIQGFRDPHHKAVYYESVIEICELLSKRTVLETHTSNKEKNSNNINTNTSSSNTNNTSECKKHIMYTAKHIDILWDICDIIFKEEKVSIFQIQSTVNLVEYCDTKNAKLKYFQFFQYLNNNETDFIDNDVKLMYIIDIIRKYIMVDEDEEAEEGEQVIKKEIEHRELTSVIMKIHTLNIEQNLKLLIMFKNIYLPEDSNYFYSITLQTFLLRILTFISDIEKAYSYRIGLYTNDNSIKVNTIIPFDFTIYTDDSIFEFINNIFLVFQGFILDDFVNFAEITSVCLVKAVQSLDQFRFRRNDYEKKCYEFLESFKQLIEDEICDQEVKLRFAKEFILTLCNIDILTPEHYMTMANYVSNDFKKKFIKRESAATVLLFSTELFYRECYGIKDGNIIEKNISLAEKEALYILSQKKEMQLLVDIIQKRMFFINEGVLKMQGLIGLKEKIKEMCDEENEQTMIMSLIDTYISELNAKDPEKAKKELIKKSNVLETIIEE